MTKVIFTLFLIAAALITVKPQSDKPKQITWDGGGISSAQDLIFVDTPRYHYFRKMDLTDNQLYRIRFVLDSLFTNYGIEMGGSQIRTAQNIYEQHINVLFGKMLRDSIKLEKPKK